MSGSSAWNDNKVRSQAGSQISRSTICNRIVKHDEFGVDDVGEINSDAANYIVVENIIFNASSEDVAMC